MIFNSYDFMIFFPIVILVYFVIPKKIRYIWLLIASYYFYMGWNAKYALLLLASTLVTWASGLVMEWIDSKQADNGDKYKKLAVAGSFIINLGILGFFKYFDFVIDNINAILGRVGISALHTEFNILLPVGISFYTFQALSYTVDVYRGEITAEKNPFRYALFVSFFPQLVAGPIERSKSLLEQVRNVDRITLWNYEKIIGGAILMLWGYFMKMVIADRAGILVDTVYDSYWAYGSVELVLASVMFAIQIYCDFGGYSLIAIGAAKVMGFDLMENFNTPYFATSIKDFWRRWHISLSSWFRDYLYIPMGGSRCSKIRHYCNLLITFLVSGLWHGASWHFVIWGGLHGIYQIIGSVIKSLTKKVTNAQMSEKGSFSYKLGQMIITFVLADIAWVFFRAKDLLSAVVIFKNIFTKWNPWVLFNDSLYGLGLNNKEMHILIVAIVVLTLVDISKYITGRTIEKVLLGERLWFRWLVIFALFFGIMLFGTYGPEYQAASFIYFQF